MTCSLPIRFPLKDRPNRANYWHNFTVTIREEKFGKGFNFTSADWIDYRTKVLSEQHNARYDGSHIHFATEQDMSWFILRYS